MARRAAVGLIALVAACAAIVAPGAAAAEQRFGANYAELETSGDTPAVRLRPSIVGGNPAAPGEWPWAVYIEVITPSFTSSCGASLVGQRWLLTAAHCITDDAGALLPGIEIFAALGAHDLNFLTQEMIREIDVVYWGFYEPQTDNSHDWALLRMTEPAPPGLQGIRFVRPEDAPKIVPGLPVGIVGWGAIFSGGPTSDVLLEATVPIIDDVTCATQIDALGGGFVPQTMLCAGVEEGGIDTCQGDSGGGIFIDDGLNLPLQIGIVSWGYGCANPFSPGLYTRLTRYQPDLVTLLRADAGAPAGPPTTTAGNHRLLGPRSAEITASVNPNGLATNVIIEFGRTAEYGDFVSGFAGLGGDVPVTLRLTGLTPGATYHYRVVVENGAGIDIGTDRRFRARGSDTVPPVVKAIPSAGTGGQIIRLKFTIYDAISDRTRERITVYSNAGDRIARFNTVLSRSQRGVVYNYAWNAPAILAGVFRFCVEGFDPTGNKSAPSCARLRIR